MFGELLNLSLSTGIQPGVICTSPGWEDLGRYFLCGLGFVDWELWE
ncbi:hypothetical protein [Vacuolonema iberomarrocanum]|nr:hypothetical protein [filamentous cyanobacterium LEGE 07170]